MALTKIGKEGIANISNSSDATAITIDSSENVLVAKTATNYQTVGVEAKSTGQLWATADGNNPILAVRKTNDGKIIAFYKDSTEVGNIQSRAGAVSTIVLDSSSTGGGISGGGGALYPTDHAGTLSNGALTLGDASYRWNNLYLAGGVFLGGTGSANQLDDYEEGTFNPVFQTGGNSNGIGHSISLGSYTKVGDRVICNGFAAMNSKDGASLTGGDVTIGGLPFTISNSNNAYSAAGFRIQNMTFADMVSLGTTINTTQLNFREITNSGSVSNLTDGNLASDSYVIFDISYRTG